MANLGSYGNYKSDPYGVKGFKAKQNAKYKATPTSKISYSPSKGYSSTSYITGKTTSSKSSSSSKKSNSSSKKKSSSSSKSNSAINDLMSLIVPTAEAASDTPTPKKTGTPGIAESLWNEAKGLVIPNLMAPGVGGIAKLAADLYTGMTTPGGHLGADITSPDAMNFPMEPNVGIDEGGIIRSDNKSPNTPYSTPSVVSKPTTFTPTGTKPQPTNRNFTPAFTPMFDITGTGVPTVLGAETEQTPVQAGNGTVRMPIGMGQLSGGAFSNGKGDLGLGGTMTGNEWAPTMDELYASANDFYSSINPELYASNEGYRNAADKMMEKTAAKEQQLGASFINNLSMLGGIPTAEAATENNMLDNLFGGTVLGASTSASNALGGMPNTAYDQNSVEKDTKKQTKAADKAWKSLQKQIESQYQQDVNTGTQGLEQQKQQDIQRLNAQFNFANSAPNDEQRIQYQQRTMNDYSGQLRDLLDKLSANRAQQMNSGQINYQNSLSAISEAKRNAGLKMQELANSQNQQRFENMLKLAQYRKANQPGFYQQAMALKNQPNSNWGSIAYNLGQNFDLTPGSEYSNALDSIMTGQAPKQSSKMVNLGNGYILDQTTGDVYQAY